MAQVRAVEDCYLGDVGYKAKGEEFEYSGTKHDSLVSVKDGKRENKDGPATTETNK